MKSLLVLPAFLAILSVPAIADDPHITPSDPVAGHPDLTYAELLKQVIPDLADDGSGGHLPDGIRHVNDDAEGEAPETVDIPFLNVAHLQVSGNPTLWLLTDLGGGGTLGTYTLLSVFSDEAQPKLIDAVEVDTDRFTNFFSDEPLRVSKTDQAMLIDSNHFNSEQNYSSPELVLLRDGKLVPGAPTFLVFGVHSCHMLQEETLTMTSKASGKGYWPITATISRALTRNKDDEDCLPDDAPSKTKTFSATFKWDAETSQYRTSSKELDQLATADENLF